MGCFLGLIFGFFLLFMVMATATAGMMAPIVLLAAAGNAAKKPLPPPPTVPLMPPSDAGPVGWERIAATPDQSKIPKPGLGYFITMGLLLVFLYLSLSVMALVL